MKKTLSCLALAVFSLAVLFASDSSVQGGFMIVDVEGKVFRAVLENNDAVSAFVKMMEDSPVTIQMRDYGGFEKVGSLGRSLPASNRQTVTEEGDIVLYQGNQIVVFYGSNSWSYTRIGRIEDITGWKEALGRGDVSITFSLAR